MTLNANEVQVGANGNVYVAPVGTALPTNETTALNASFIDLGYISEDGINFTDGQTKEDVKVWQSFYPLRTLVTEKATAVEFVLKQWNHTTVPLAFGGGSVTSTSGHTKYQPPVPGTLDYRAMIIHWIDGADIFRLVIPRGLVSGEVQSKIVRNAASDLPIHFDAQPSGAADPLVDSTQPWYLLTNAFILT